MVAPANPCYNWELRASILLRLKTIAHEVYLLVLLAPRPLFAPERRLHYGTGRAAGHRPVDLHESGCQFERQHSRRRQRSGLRRRYVVRSGRQPRRSGIPSNHRVLIYQGASDAAPPTAELPTTGSVRSASGTPTVVLGQPDFTTTTENYSGHPAALRLPTAVASDGVHVVVADTNHNRVLIWNRIPSVNNQPADVVVGQPDFTIRIWAGNFSDCQVDARPAGRLDSERQAVRRRHAEQPRPDLQLDSDHQWRSRRCGAGSSPISRPSSSPT